MNGTALCGYFGVVMILIFYWVFTGGDFHPWYLIGMPALIAAIFF